MSRVRTGDLTTHVQRLPAADGDPDAPLAVLVHGLLTDSLASYYFTLGPAFAAAGVDVLMYDLRAHGRSERPATGYRLEHFVDDLALLLDALGETRPAHVVGNSFGGSIATGLAAWHPEKVASVVMLEAEPPRAAWVDRMAVALDDAKTRLCMPGVLEWIDTVVSQHTAKLARGAVKILQTTSVAEEVAHSRTVGDDLAEIGCPLLGIYGDESVLAPQAAEIAELLPSCRTVVLPEQGHSVLIERTDEVRDHVLDWVRGHAMAEAAR